jgi:hypothetical protein
MISAQTLRGCREGKPVSIFPDHALARSSKPPTHTAPVFHYFSAAIGRRLRLIVGNLSHQKEKWPR